MERIDLTGKRFGKLVVIKFAKTDVKRGTFWECRCDCGRSKIVRGSNLRSGNSKSCGLCYRVKHGRSRSKIYRVWANMRERCTNPKASEYNAYGGRGIAVCEKWMNSFPAFYEWALQAGYIEDAPRGEFTLDRIDNDGPYCPENCRFIPMIEQYKNMQKSNL